MTPDRVREVIDGLLGGGRIVARSDGSIHRLFPVAIGGAEGSSLCGWVIREGATRTIEVGFGYGVSTLFICEGVLRNGGGSHLVIDPHQATRFADCGWQFLEDAGVASLVEHHTGESQIVLPELLHAGRTFDLAFVDGNHRFEGVFVDLVYLGRLVRPGGVIFLDDHQLPAVARAASFFVTNLGWTLEEESAEGDDHHWAVLRTNERPDTRAFDYYVDF